MDLRDLGHVPRALPILAEMSRFQDPFSESALVAASGLEAQRGNRLRDLCHEMADMGLLSMVMLPKKRGRYVEATPVGRRVGQLAEEIHAALAGSPARFYGNNRVPFIPAGGPV
jgi:hypothetical protein